MTLTDAQLDEAYGSYCRRLQDICRRHRDRDRITDRLRRRMVDRGRLRPVFLSGWRWLEAHGRNGLRAEERHADLQQHLRAQRETFGVPIWVFAIVLKVIASVLIDLWLPHAPAAEGGA